MNMIRFFLTIPVSIEEFQISAQIERMTWHTKVWFKWYRLISKISL